MMRVPVGQVAVTSTMASLASETSHWPMRMRIVFEDVHVPTSTRSLFTNVVIRG
jgi:hypothetical protein